MRWFFLLLLISSTAHSVQLTADLSSGVGTNTCDWNTTLGKIRAPLSANGTALNFGTGADGHCNFSGTKAAGTYNCKTLTISSDVRFTGSSPVVIRVQGQATISATLSVDGFPGTNGTQTSPPTSVNVAGGAAGPGGFKGGDFDGSILVPSNGNSDDVAAAGQAGGNGLQNAAELNGAGGGGGGGNSTIGLLGADGIATAGNQGFGGANSATETTTVDTDFDITLIGGAGGGSGGSGVESASSTFYYGGSGGGGGGALHLIVGGEILITSSGIISANGGKGGNASQLGAGGGGGAGGAIFLQAAGSVTNNGIIRANGGAGGTVSSSTTERGGSGGAGGNGFVRIDTFAGSLSGSASTPAANNSLNVSYSLAACSSVTTAFDTIGILNRFTLGSAIQTLNGGTLTIQVQESSDGVTWGGLVALTSVTTFTKRYLRFDISLTSASTTSSPELDSIIVNYDVIEKSTEEFKSSVSCGSVDMNPPNGPGGISLLTGLLLALFVFIPKRKLRSSLQQQD
ncbi:MAG: hypothetical protein K2P81_11140 [Bacteriovoracaceae bacterium]|nr:hypothetical protein [Bacteriovoracaceae bacterium]